MEFPTPEEILQAKKLVVKDPLLQKIMAAFEFYHDSPYAECYQTLRDQISDLNLQLKIVYQEDGTVAGRIDIFKTEEKDFDRGARYFKEILSYIQNMDGLRKLMSPQEQENVSISDKLKRIENRRRR